MALLDALPAETVRLPRRESWSDRIDFHAEGAAVALPQLRHEILGLTAVAKDAGELAAAGVHVLGRTVAEVADAWAPYLTMAEGIRIAAKALTTDPSLLSCCA